MAAFAGHRMEPSAASVRPTADQWRVLTPGCGGSQQQNELTLPEIEACIGAVLGEKPRRRLIFDLPRTGA